MTNNSIIRPFFFGICIRFLKSVSSNEDSAINNDISY